MTGFGTTISLPIIQQPSHIIKSKTVFLRTIWTYKYRSILEPYKYYHIIILLYVVDRFVLINIPRTLNGDHSLIIKPMIKLINVIDSAYNIKVKNVRRFKS